MNAQDLDKVSPSEVRDQLRGLIERLQTFEAGLTDSGVAPRVKTTLKQSVALTLADQGPMTVTDLAARLQVAHPGVVQAARQLQGDGYLMTAKDRYDRRRRVLALTREGQHVFGVAIAQRDLLLSEPNVLSALNAAFQALDALPSVNRTAVIRDLFSNNTAIELKPVADIGQEVILRFIHHELGFEASREHVLDPLGSVTEQKRVFGAGAYLRDRRQMIGLILARSEGHQVELTDLLVHRQLRTLGVGQILLSWLSQISREAGYAMLKIDARRLPTQSRTFLQKRGFVASSVQDGENPKAREDGEERPHGAGETGSLTRFLI
jgi:DNA-binding MarR family transcriptional regulator